MTMLDKTHQMIKEAISGKDWQAARRYLRIYIRALLIAFPDL